MSTTYKSARALEMAVKEAAKASPLDTGRAVSRFYFHRLLCRVFAHGNNAFVLKGGQSMLARTLDARMTRDIDLLSTQPGIEDALDDLLRASREELGDFVSFELIEARPIKADDEYRQGMSVRFAVSLGAKRMQDISIDLVVDQIPLDHAELVTPADRIEVSGIESFDYLVYPVESALADKLCALSEKHEGRASSRVKDLVDIAVYATTCEINGDELQRSVRRELSARKLEWVRAFAVPQEWGDAQARQYAKLCMQTGLPEPFRTLDSAEKLASDLLGPAINAAVNGRHWDRSSLAWRM